MTDTETLNAIRVSKQHRRFHRLDLPKRREVLKELEKVEKLGDVELKRVLDRVRRKR